MDSFASISSDSSESLAMGPFGIQGPGKRNAFYLSTSDFQSDTKGAAGQTYYSSLQATPYITSIGR